MNSVQDCFHLSDGTPIPCIAFGTYLVPPESAESVVRMAFEAGYTHIDTAAFYANEEGVGRAIKTCGIPREKLFITTKLWNDDRGSYEDVLRAFDTSMKKLGLDYLDLYLIHWPNPVRFRDRWEWINAETWRAMEHLVNEGRIRSIGLSNFFPHHIDTLLKTANIMPAVNQLKINAACEHTERIEYSKKHGMCIEAYCPLGRGTLLSEPELVSVAAKHGKSTAQILLRWCVERGYIALPKSLNPDRVRENIDIFGFSLDVEDLAALAPMNGRYGFGHDADTVQM